MHVDMPARVGGNGALTKQTDDAATDPSRHYSSNLPTKRHRCPHPPSSKIARRLEGVRGSLIVKIARELPGEHRSAVVPT